MIGELLSFMVPPNADNDVLSYFQARMPYGIAVLDVDDACMPDSAGPRRDLRRSRS
jgi:hypothetical protein